MAELTDITTPGVSDPIDASTASTVESAYLAPGAELVTAADAANLETVAALGVERDGPVYEAALIIPTATPEENAEARDNIKVTGEPGTVGAIGS